MMITERYESIKDLLYNTIPVACYADDNMNIMFVANPEDTATLIRELVVLGYTPALIDYDPDSYDKEYEVGVCGDTLYVDELYNYERDRYLGTSAEIVYVLNDCNIKSIEKIESDTFIEVEIDDSFGVSDDDGCKCDRDCTNCSMFDEEDFAYFDDIDDFEYDFHYDEKYLDMIEFANAPRKFTEKNYRKSDYNYDNWFDWF